MKDYNLLLGQKIKIARKECKLTQKDLADKIGVIRATIAKYEAGQIKISLETIDSIARHTKKPIIWFYDFDENQDKKTKEAIEELDASNRIIFTHDRLLEILDKKMELAEKRGKIYRSRSYDLNKAYTTKKMLDESIELSKQAMQILTKEMPDHVDNYIKIKGMDDFIRKVISYNQSSLHHLGDNKEPKNKEDMIDIEKQSIEINENQLSVKIMQSFDQNLDELIDQGNYKQAIQQMRYYIDKFELLLFQCSEKTHSILNDIINKEPYIRTRLNNPHFRDYNIPKQYWPIGAGGVHEDMMRQIEEDNTKPEMITASLPEKAEFTAEILGESMQPTISDKATIYYKKILPGDIKNNDLIVFFDTRSNEFKLRRARCTEYKDEKICMLIADNPEHTDCTMIDENISIIGLVVYGENKIEENS